MRVNSLNTSAHSENSFFHGQSLQFLRDFKKSHYFGQYSHHTEETLIDYFKSRDEDFLIEVTKPNTILGFEKIQTESENKKQTDTGEEENQNKDNNIEFPQIEYSINNGKIIAEFTNSENFNYSPFMSKMIMDQMINQTTTTLKIKMLVNDFKNEKGRICHFDLRFKRTLGDRFNFSFQMNIVNEFVDFKFFYFVFVIIIFKWTILLLILFKEINRIIRLNFEYNIWYKIRVCSLIYVTNLSD